MWFFNKSRSPQYTDFSVIGTDMHSHLIPGIDDGSKDMQESIDLVTKLYHLGYKKLITTPHVNGDSYNNTPEIIKDGLERLRNAVKNTGIPIELNAAAEYHLDDRFEEKFKSGKILTMGKKYILLELPFIHEPENFYSVVFDLQINGYKVILAHTERYTYWYGNIKKYEDLHDREIFFQINILSLTGFYSKPVKKAAEWLIDNQIISFLGTDAHNMEHIENIAKSLSEKSLQKLMASGKLLNSTL